MCDVMYLHAAGYLATTNKTNNVEREGCNYKSTISTSLMNLHVNRDWQTYSWNE